MPKSFFDSYFHIGDKVSIMNCDGGFKESCAHFTITDLCFVDGKPFVSLGDYDGLVVFDSVYSELEFYEDPEEVCNVS